MSSNSPKVSADSVRQQLTDAYSKLQKRSQSIPFLKGGFVLLIWVISLLLIESFAYLGWEYKSLFLLISLGISFLIIRRERASHAAGTFSDFYRNFSRSSGLPELKDALDLQNSSSNKDLVDAAILQNMRRIRPETLSVALNEYISDSNSARQHRMYLQLSATAFVVLAFCAFNFSSSAVRSLTFWQSFQKPNPYSFTVTPGDTTLEQGTGFVSSLQFAGTLFPDEVYLMLKTDAETEFRRRAMQAAGNSFRSASFDLNAGIEYYFEMDGYETDRFNASVQLRPRFRELNAGILPPSYTGLDSTSQTYPFSKLSPYQGSMIRLQGSLNKDVESIRMIRNSGDSLFSASDSQFVYSYPVAEKDTLRFSITDRSGLKNSIPFQIIVDPVSDEYPVVDIIEPKGAIEKIEPRSVNILYQASDDFELRSARLYYELKRAYVNEPVKGSVNLERPVSGVAYTYSWDLTEIGLRPLDVLSYWIEVRDNDGYNGSKSSRSRTLTLSVPSVVDYLEGISGEEDDVQKDLEEIGENFDEIGKKYDEFKERLKENPRGDYEQKRSLEQINKEQQALEEQISEMNEKFEEIKKELSENNMISDDTRKMYEELDKLMKEIDDPEFRKALEELQEKMGQMNPDEMRDAMENAEFNEELYKERLERTLELFKQLKTNSDLEKLARSLEDMAEREKELFEQGDEEQIRNESQQTASELEKLKEQLDKLPQESPERSKESLKEFNESMQDSLSQMQQEMQKREDEQQSGESGQQQQQQDQQKPQSQEQQMKKMAQQTRQQMKNMQQQQMNINIAGLRYILYSLLNLSNKQEELVQRVEESENRSQAFITMAREERNLEGIFNNLADSLTTLSQEIPQFANQINKTKLEVKDQLTRTVEQMAERRQRTASVASRQSLGGVNQISFDIANLLEQISNESGSGSGSASMEQMMQQMQQTGEQQRKLNEEIQNMINDMQGDRLNRDQMERLNEMARQQNAIREQLEELRRSGALQEGDQIGSEIERMIEQMENTINDLRGGALDRNLVQRQQNILSRMLNAEDALQERDEEEKREGTTADPLTAPKPPDMTLEDLEKEIRKRLNDPDFTKYSSDYQILIRTYFEKLKEKEKQQIN